MKKNSTVYFAKNMADVLYQLKTTSGLRICGAGTLDNSLPDIVLFIRNINDFKRVEKSSEYNSYLLNKSIYELFNSILEWMINLVDKVRSN